MIANVVNNQKLHIPVQDKIVSYWLTHQTFCSLTLVIEHEDKTCSIICQGNPIHTVKTHATKNCDLCTKGRIGRIGLLKATAQVVVNFNNLWNLWFLQTTSQISWVFRVSERSPPAMISQSITKESIQKHDFHGQQVKCLSCWCLTKSTGKHAMKELFPSIYPQSILRKSPTPGMSSFGFTLER